MIGEVIESDFRKYIVFGAFEDRDGKLILLCFGGESGYKLLRVKINV